MTNDHPPPDTPKILEVLEPFVDFCECQMRFGANDFAHRHDPPRKHGLHDNLVRRDYKISVFKKRIGMKTRRRACVRQTCNRHAPQNASAEEAWRPGRRSGPKASCVPRNPCPRPWRKAQPARGRTGLVSKRPQKPLSKLPDLALALLCPPLYSLYGTG